VAYLHCHSCNWSQDDFYSEEGYNPASYLSQFTAELLGDGLDKVVETDTGPITWREVLARDYERFAQKIRTMEWFTYEQWEKDKDTAVCPGCGDRNFDID